MEKVELVLKVNYVYVFVCIQAQIFEGYNDVKKECGQQFKINLADLRPPPVAAGMPATDEMKVYVAFYPNLTYIIYK